MNVLWDAEKYHWYLEHNDEKVSVPMLKVLFGSRQAVSDVVEPAVESPAGYTTDKKGVFLFTDRDDAERVGKIVEEKSR